MNEDSIRDAIVEALKLDERLSSQSIEVEVVGESVTLSGDVHSFRRKLAAQEIALSIAPDAMIDNRLEVVPPENPSDEHIADEVRALIEERATLTREAIVVEVRAGRVVLSGAVASEEQRTLIEDVALLAPGALHVSNQLAIDPDARMDSYVAGSELEELLSRDESLRGCDLRVSITGDVAVLSGKASSQEHLEIALHLIRSAWKGTLRNETIVDG